MCSNPHTATLIIKKIKNYTEIFSGLRRDGKTGKGRYMKNSMNVKGPHVPRDALLLQWWRHGMDMGTKTQNVAYSPHRKSF